MGKADPQSSAGGDPRAADRAPLITIVDDDESVRRSMDRLMRSFGYRTQVFGSGREFLGSEAREEAACLLLDMRMPGLDGLDVQRSLAERGSRLPIVFVTGQASDEEERRARSAGAAGFLRKPIDPADLRRAIEDGIRTSVRGDRNGNRG